jgi:proline iminopeptidase
MDPAYMEMMGGELKQGRHLRCPNGSHMAMYDDQRTYFDGVNRFMRDVDAGR